MAADAAFDLVGSVSCGRPVERGWRPPRHLGQRPEMRAALAERDIADVYRILQKCGISQRRIAAPTA